MRSLVIVLSGLFLAVVGAAALAQSATPTVDCNVPEPGTIIVALAVLGPAGLAFKRKMTRK